MQVGDNIGEVKKKCNFSRSIKILYLFQYPASSLLLRQVNTKQILHRPIILSIWNVPVPKPKCICYYTSIYWLLRKIICYFSSLPKGPPDCWFEFNRYLFFYILTKLLVRGQSVGLLRRWSSWECLQLWSWGLQPFSKSTDNGRCFNKIKY